MTGPRTIQELLDALAELKRAGAPAQPFEEREAERRKRIEAAYVSGCASAKRAAGRGHGKGAGAWRQPGMRFRSKRSRA
jgi:hypothetical protein